MIVTPEKCKELTDSEIIAKSLENLDYFSCLYQRFEPDLLRYIFRISGLDTQEAQDILQDSFIKVWRNLNEFDATLKLSSWIYRIVHNETVSYIRKKKSYGKDNTIDVELYYNILTEESSKSSDPGRNSFFTMEILDRLPFKYKDVMVLKFLEKKSYEEISDILKIPEGTVAIRINRAKKKLREIYEKNNDH
jgi:RNA polymerase sigma-70 factor, ECF subfamily